MPLNYNKSCNDFADFPKLNSFLIEYEKAAEAISIYDVQFGMVCHLCYFIFWWMIFFVFILINQISSNYVFFCLYG